MFFIRNPFLVSFRPSIMTKTNGLPSTNKVRLPVNSRCHTKQEKSKTVFAHKKNPFVKFIA
jgi:hypothetical protein